MTGAQVSSTTIYQASCPDCPWWSEETGDGEFAEQEATAHNEKHHSPVD